MPILSLLALCFFCVLSGAAGGTAEPGQAQQQQQAIWSGLVLATNNSNPAQAPACLRPFAAKLKNIFGYNQFELVGESAEKMDDPYERWLVPSKDFCLSVKTHNEPGAHYPTKVVLFQNRRRLAEFETHLGAESPLFIRGPLYAGGQLVIVLHVMNASDLPPRPPRPAAPPVNPLPVSVATAPKEKERGGAMPVDRVGPNPLSRPGDVDSKSNKP